MHLLTGRNIYFLGFMASGKSHIGRLFAKKIGWPFCDTDELVEKKADKKISDIFAEHGEQHFRDIETSVIKECSEQKNRIISLGGGAILRDENWEYMQKSGFTVLLSCQPKILFERISASAHRPLMANLSENDRMEKINDMLKQREPFYKKAQFEFDNSGHLSAEKLVSTIYQTLLEQV